jgi:type VI secretion system protein ImpK
MTSDQRDKTVFKQSSFNPDRTVIRPSPGGRGAGPRNPAPPPQAAPVAPPPAPESSQAQRNTQFRADLEHVLPAGGNMVTQSAMGLNPIVNAAGTLIAVYENTRHSMSNANIGGLHQRLTAEIRQFETRIKDVGVKPELVLTARYLICAALDEAVLNTPWGSESAWTQRTLLSLFHSETSGGEKFFQILDRMLEYPAENIDMLELVYILLSLGFEGKYRVVNRGRDMIETIRDNLFQVIRRHRGEYERSLSPQWQGLGKTSNSLTSYIPLWVVASVLGAVLLLSYSGFRIWMFESSEPVVTRLDQISQFEVEKR